MKKLIISLSACVHLLYASLLSASNDNITNIINKQSDINKESLRSQKRINKLSDENRINIDQYKRTVYQTDNFETYNQHLESMIKSQKIEEESLNKQLKSINITSQGIIPLMLKMISALEKYIELDVPFLYQERHTRVSEIGKMMTRSDISTSEKYRRILEAYQIEIDYGRTIEAYTDILNFNNQKRSVNFLRLGRVVFIYQSLDGSESGLWDSASKSWKIISDDYKRDISKAIRMAKKQLPPDLLILPVKSPEVAR